MYRDWHSKLVALNSTKFADSEFYYLVVGKVIRISRDNIALIRCFINFVYIMRPHSRGEFKKT